MTLEKQLDLGLRALGVDLQPSGREKLLRFLRLLEKWNQVYNLTAIRDTPQMVTRHLLDGLSIVPEIRGPQILDIGTGAGLPGIPLAVALPACELTLLDSNARKIHFVRQAVHELRLKNINAVHTRVERFVSDKKFATLIARAFASIPDMLMQAGHLCAAGSRFLVMKGNYPRQELAAIPEGYRIEVKALHVPGLEAARHVVVLERRE